MAEPGVMLTPPAMAALMSRFHPPGRSGHTRVAALADILADSLVGPLVEPLVDPRMDPSEL